MEIARSIRVIQIDSIAVAGAPTQYLVPFSRLGPYDRAILDRLVFVDRRLFHYVAHRRVSCLNGGFPIFATTMRPYSKRTDKWAFRAANGWRQMPTCGSRFSRGSGNVGRCDHAILRTLRPRVGSRPGGPADAMSTRCWSGSARLLGQSFARGPGGTALLSFP